jgi:hypothetical protein
MSSMKANRQSQLGYKKEDTMVEGEGKSLHKAIDAFRKTRQRRNSAAAVISGSTAAPTKGSSENKSGKQEYRKREESTTTKRSKTSSSSNATPVSTGMASDPAASMSYLPDDVSTRLTNFYKQAEMVKGGVGQFDESEEEKVGDSDAVQQAMKSIEMADSAFANYSRAMTEVAGVTSSPPKAFDTQTASAFQATPHTTSIHMNPERAYNTSTQRYVCN